MKQLALTAIAALAITASAVPAHAGSIALTGHDDDYHCAAGDSNACSQLSALVDFAKDGSKLPLLTFDAGSELTSDLMSLGIAFTNVNPESGVSASLFNHSMFSAFVVASDTTCGGCDNDSVGEAAIAAQSKAINSFLNAGGGIVGLAGADSPGYYSFVPQTATSVGGAPSSGYSQTSVGAKYGIDAVNGDPTHNLFSNPGTSGESKFYQVAEVNAYGNSSIPGPTAATTLLCFECTVDGGGVIVGPGPGPTVTPEPSSIFLLGSGLLGTAGVLRRRIFKR